LEYSLEGGEKNGIPPSTMFLVQMVWFGYGAIVGRWRESVNPGDLVMIDVSRSDYDGQLGIVISRMDQDYFKIFVSNIGFLFYMKNSLKVINETG
jgi:hypothetical protein